MRTSERLRGLKQWAYETLCQGRLMKAPAENGDLTKIVRQEPKVFLGWQPTRPDESGYLDQDPVNVCPGILIMPAPSTSKYVEEKRFDRYSNAHRPQEMGQALNVNILFSVYEPGIRLPGFVESADSEEGLDMTKIIEGTEQGLYTLFNWMDDCVQGLLQESIIPGTDMYLSEADLCNGLYTDQSFVVDKRPIYYGFVNARFYSYAEEGNNKQVNSLLL